MIVCVRLRKKDPILWNLNKWTRVWHTWAEYLLCKKSPKWAQAVLKWMRAKSEGSLLIWFHLSWDGLNSVLSLPWIFDYKQERFFSKWLKISRPSISKKKVDINQKGSKFWWRKIYLVWLENNDWKGTKCLLKREKEKKLSYLV